MAAALLAYQRLAAVESVATIIARMSRKPRDEIYQSINPNAQPRAIALALKNRY